MSKKKTISLFVILTLIITTIVIYKVYNKPHVDTSSTVADFSIKSATLLDNFSNNEEQANTEYLDKIIQVTGPIAKLAVVNDETIISLGDGDIFGNVTCHLTPEESKKNHNLKEGQVVTIKGICTGYLMNVILVKSVLIN